MHQAYNISRIDTSHINIILILYSYINLSCHTYIKVTVRRTKINKIKSIQNWIQKFQMETKTVQEKKSKLQKK